MRHMAGDDLNRGKAWKQQAGLQASEVLIELKEPLPRSFTHRAAGWRPQVFCHTGPIPGFPSVLVTEQLTWSTEIGMF